MLLTVKYSLDTLSLSFLHAPVVVTRKVNIRPPRLSVFIVLLFGISVIHANAEGDRPQQQKLYYAYEDHDQTFGPVAVPSTEKTKHQQFQSFPPYFSAAPLMTVEFLTSRYNDERYSVPYSYQLSSPIQEGHLEANRIDKARYIADMERRNLASIATTQVQKILASGFMGNSVSMSGKVIVAGARFDNSPVLNAGEQHIS
jgi:hypothetical protein